MVARRPRKARLIRASCCTHAGYSISDRPGQIGSPMIRTCRCQLGLLRRCPPGRPRDQAGRGCWCSWWLLALARRRSVARSGFTAPRPRVGGPELRSPRVDVWDEAVQFLLIGDRARQLAERHPLTADGCSSCARPGCVAARMAVAALELLEQRERLRSERDRSATAARVAAYSEVLWSRIDRARG